MQTEILYMKDIEANYMREFSAAVAEAGPDFVVLDRTAFYAQGGGQETDTGKMRWPGGEAAVIAVKKEQGITRHYLQGPVPPAGTAVTCEIDWQRRHAHMRYHTSQHILSGVMYEKYGARTVGNQIYADRSRVDFSPVNLGQSDGQAIEAAVNEILLRGVVVRIYHESRASLEGRLDAQRANIDLLPQSVRDLRIVDIENVDVCPCAGTHVRGTAEIGRMKITRVERKGKDRFRLEYRLEQ